MSLRLRINLIITALIVAFTLALTALEIYSTRASVGEEIEAASRVTTQLISRVVEISNTAGTDGMLDFFRQLGRVRANEIRLIDASGEELYRSPKSAYKAGRSAPRWFSQLVSPPLYSRVIDLPNGRIEIRPDATRAVLDGWDDLLWLLGVALMAFVLSNLLMFWLAGRALRPLNTVVSGMHELQHGNYAVRLPKMSSTEMQKIGLSFNQMAQAVADSAKVRQAEARTRAELAENRALTEEIQSRIEQERGAIARELHDELGQQITAIKTLGLSIAQRSAGKDLHSEQAARLVMSTADQIYDVIHHMIPRLRPLALDHFGLSAALDDLISDWRGQHPGIQFEWHNRLGTRVLPEKIATAAYRIVQEAVTNALRHSGADRIRIELHTTTEMLTIEIIDNGVGLPRDWLKKGHFGVIGMQERAQVLGGSLELAPAGADTGSSAGRGPGLAVRAQLPIESAGAPAQPDLSTVNQA